jgi:hypothetical protein
MEVVAEGVETAEQLTALRALQCNYGQGYLFAKPLEAQAATALHASHSGQRGNRMPLSRVSCLLKRYSFLNRDGIYYYVCYAPGMSAAGALSP